MDASLLHVMGLVVVVVVACDVEGEDLGREGTADRGCR